MSRRNLQSNTYSHSTSKSRDAIKDKRNEDQNRRLSHLYEKKYRTDNTDVMGQNSNTDTTNINREPIAIIVRQRVDNPQRGPIEMNIDKPETIIIKRRFGEGSKPLFERSDICVNVGKNDDSGLNSEKPGTSGLSFEHTKQRPTSYSKSNRSTSPPHRRRHRELSSTPTQSTTSSHSSFSCDSDCSHNSKNKRREKYSTHKADEKKRLTIDKKNNRSKSRSRSSIDPVTRKYSRSRDKSLVTSPNKSKSKEKIPYFVNSNREAERRERLNEIYRRQRNRRRSRDRSRSRSMDRRRNSRTRSSRSRRSKSKSPEARERTDNTQVAPMGYYPPYPYPYPPPMWYPPPGQPGIRPPPYGPVPPFMGVPPPYMPMYNPYFPPRIPMQPRMNRFSGAIRPRQESSAKSQGK